MRRTFRPWTVLPHGPLERLADDLWTVQGALPRSPIPRRMTVARIADGRLVFHNAVPLAEPSMLELERAGAPAFLLVPNGYHRLDLAAWKARFPELVVLAPAAARARVAQEAAVDGTFEDLPGAPALRAETLDGSRWQEAAIVFRSGAGAALLFGDTVMNLPHLPGPAGLAYRLLGSTGGPRVTRIARLLTVSDPAALAHHLARLAEEPGLALLVPSHGEVVRERAPEVLRGVARTLAAR